MSGQEKEFGAVRVSVTESHGLLRSHSRLIQRSGDR